MATKYLTKDGSKIYFNEEHEMLRRTVNEFVKKEINPFMNEWEEKEIAPLHDLFKRIGNGTVVFLGLWQPCATHHAPVLVGRQGRSNPLWRRLPACQAGKDACPAWLRRGRPTRNSARC